MNSISEGQIELTWEENSSTYDANQDDKVMLLVYNPAKKEAFSVMNGNDRESTRQIITLPSHFKGDEVHCWISFKKKTGSLVSNSKYVGSLVVTWHKNTSQNSSDYLFTGLTIGWSSDFFLEGAYAFKKSIINIQMILPFLFSRSKIVVQTLPKGISLADDKYMKIGWLSICLFVYLSICLFVYLSICLFV